MDTEETKEEVKEEVKEEEMKEESKDEDMKEEEEEETEPPVVELTEEEKKQWFRKPAVGATSDLTSVVLSQSFGKFTIPDQDEGFDDLRFEWQNAAESKEYLG